MQKIIYTGDDFPEIDFRDQAIAWLNARAGQVYDSSLDVAEYCINQSTAVPEGLYFKCGAGYKLVEISGPCHAALNKAADKTTTYIVNLFTRNLHQSVDRPFLEFFLSPTDSPWRSVLQDLYVIRDKNNDSYPIGYLLNDINEHHLHVVTNFIIAGRLVSAWSQGVIQGHLINSGFNKEEALVLGPLFYCSSTGLQSRGVDYKDVSIFEHDGVLRKTETWKNVYYYSKRNYGYMSGDMPFNSYADPWKIINGKPTPNGEATLLGGSNPNPCNYIWDKCPKISGPTFELKSDLLGFCVPWAEDFKVIPKERIETLKTLLNQPNYNKRIDV